MWRCNINFTLVWLKISNLLQAGGDSWQPSVYLSGPWLMHEGDEADSFRPSYTLGLVAQLYVMHCLRAKARNFCHVMLSVIGWFLTACGFLGTYKRDLTASQTLPSVLHRLACLIMARRIQKSIFPVIILSVSIISFFSLITIRLSIERNFLSSLTV